jgi:hypothetical protein
MFVRFFLPVIVDNQFLSKQLAFEEVIQFTIINIGTYISTGTF